MTWDSHPHAVRKRSKAPWLIIGGLGVVVLLFIVIGVASGGSDNEPSGVQTPPPASEPKEKPSEAAPEPSERDDLLEVKLDDRSIPDFADYWMTYEVKNHSSKESDYMLRVDVIDNATGKRVFNAYDNAYNVKPGQTHQGEAYLSNMEENGDYTLKVTKFDRTKSW